MHAYYNPNVPTYHVTCYNNILLEGTCKILLTSCCKVYGPPRQAAGEEDDDDDDEPKVEEWMKALGTVPKHAHRAHCHPSRFCLVTGVHHYTSISETRFERQS